MLPLVTDSAYFFYKTVYVESQDFTQALKFYTSGARDAHDIFHGFVLLHFVVCTS